MELSRRTRRRTIHYIRTTATGDCKRGAVLATNTAYIDTGQIAASNSPLLVGLVERGQDFDSLNQAA